MSRRGTYISVGLLVVVTLALLIGLVFFIAGNRFAHGVKYETYFSESVQGLDVGTPVKYRGVTIGQVTDIGLVAADYGKNEPGPGKPRNPMFHLVVVRFVVDPTRIGYVPDAITATQQGLRVKLGSQGLATGLSYLELDYVPPEQYPAQPVPWQPRDIYIPSIPSTIAQVQNAAQDFLAKLRDVDVNRLADSITGLTEDLRRELAAGGDVHATLTEATETLRSVRQEVTRADLPGVATALRHAAGSVDELATGRQTRTLLATANTAADRLSRAADRLPALIATLQATAERADHGTADAEANLAPLLSDLRGAAENLRDTTELLRRDPSQVLLGAPPPRPKR
ncbi:MAG TPA: MlaD family protein [Acetobacteraceae bacterium]|nr:MlaD family protein [Acetobacteraceae bacterium]